MTDGLRRLALLAMAVGVAACGRGSEEHSMDDMAGMRGMSPPREIPDSTRARIQAMPLPAAFAAGEAAFDANCAQCHGPRAFGTAVGPPLVHIIYEPGHHADIAFRMAAGQGVRAHHWGFGDMAPVPAATPEDVEAIIGYVRFLQREAGIH